MKSILSRLSFSFSLLLLLSYYKLILSTTHSYSETKIYSKYLDRKDYFGYSVSIYEDWIISGAFSSSSFQLDSGAVFSFWKNESLESNITDWVEMPYLTSTDLKPHDYFGGSVALWKSTAVIGAYLDENIGAKSGSVYIFNYIDGGWKEQQKLTSLGGIVAADYFGQSVDIYEDSIIVGAYRQQFRGIYRGAAYIYTKALNIWTLSGILRPNDMSETRNNMMFGYAVQILNNTAVIGAYGDDFQGPNTGAIYIFQYKYFDQTNSIGEWVQTHKLIPRDARQQSNFGISIDISREYVQNNRGYFLTILAGANLGRGLAAGTGSAYLFRSSVVSRTSSPQWTQQSKLYAPDGIGEELFGSSVSIDGPLIAIGAPDDSTRGTDAGSVYVFRRSATSSSSSGSSSSSSSNSGSSSSSSSSSSGSSSSSLDSGSSSSSTSHNVKWSFVHKVIGNDTQPYDNFGSSVAVYENTIVIGSVHTNGLVASSGAIYIIVEDKPQSVYIKKTISILKNEKDQFVFILSLFPILLVLLPVCVMSSVVYFNQHYSAVVLALRRGVRGNDVALQEYASLHGLSSSSHHSTNSSNTSGVQLNELSNSSTHSISSNSTHGSNMNMNMNMNMNRRIHYVGWEGVSAAERIDELPEILKNVNREDSPMLFHHLIHSGRKVRE